RPARRCARVRVGCRNPGARRDAETACTIEARLFTKSHEGHEERFKKIRALRAFVKARSRISQEPPHADRRRTDAPLRGSQQTRCGSAELSLKPLAPKKN